MKKNCEHTDKRSREYSEQTRAEFFARSMTEALVLEAASWPKAGLVSVVSQGVHMDMDFVTLVRSSLCLDNFFRSAFLVGITKSNCDDCSGLERKLREIGILAECEMYQATGSRNTHKGSIYLGLLVAGAGGVLSSKNSFEFPRIDCVCQLAGSIGRKHAVRSLEAARKWQDDESTMSVGLKAYRQYSLQGIRGEVISGLKTICRTVIPSLRSSYTTGVPLRRALIDCIFAVMSELDDTTLLNRGFDLNRIVLAKTMARAVLEAGSTSTTEGMKRIMETMSTFASENLSPGGSADLVAIGLGLFMLEEGYPRFSWRWNDASSTQFFSDFSVLSTC